MLKVIHCNVDAVNHTFIPGRYMVIAAEKAFMETCNKNSHLFFSFKSYFQIFPIELLSLFNADALFIK